MKKLIRNSLGALALSALISPAALAGGPEIFQAQGCTKCHSITGQGIQRDADADEEGKDLSKVGATHDKKAIALFLLKKTEIDGEKHKKRFQGTTEELKELATWLGTLK